MHLSRDTMNAHIAAGRAQQWSQPLGGEIPTAALFDDTWYVVLDGTDHYQPAAPALAAILTQTQTLLAAADHTITLADTQPRQ